jgi:hypothetical protein
MYLIPPEGLPVLLSERDTNPTLHELQEAVGGYIQYAPLPEACTFQLIANEDGISLELMHNPKASAMMYETWIAHENPEHILKDFCQLYGPVVWIENPAPEEGEA